MLPRLVQILLSNNVCRQEAELITEVIREECSVEMSKIEKQMSKHRKKGAKDFTDELTKLQQKRSRHEETIPEPTPHTSQTDEPLQKRLIQLKKNVKECLEGVIKCLKDQKTSSKDIKPPTINVTPEVTTNPTDQVLTIIHEVLLKMEFPLKVHVAETLVSELRKVYGDIREIQANCHNLITFDIKSKNEEANNINHCILEALRHGMSTADIISFNR